MRPGNAGERPVRSRCPRACATHRGSVYFGMIVAVTIVGVLLMQTSTLWSATNSAQSAWPYFEKVHEPTIVT